MHIKLTRWLALGSLVAALVPAQAQQPHPRLWLDAPTLTTLRQRAIANSPAWTALKAQVDTYLTGTVEWPDGDPYPNGGSIGEGYQGDGYFPALVNVGLCYQMAKTVDKADAPKYAAKGIDILTKMSAPSGVHAPNPFFDDGYGIRNYGVGMALGYDWLYEAMTPAQRQRVYTALNVWIAAYDMSGFGNNFPQGNMFAGYYAAKALGALATEGDNPKAPTQWSDWLNRLHNKMVRPYYAANLAGGGWPEGWNYGPPATLNMIWPLWAARTAKGLDLLNVKGQPYTWPVDQGLHVMHFTWPNRLSLDDRNYLYDRLNPSETRPNFYTALAWILQMWNAPVAPRLHKFARIVRSLQTNSDYYTEAWEEFLFWDEAAKEQDFTTLPLSYLASGMKQVAMRSSWTTDAVWGSFLSGPFLNDPNNGEELFDKGGLAIVRGGTPLLVNAPGAMMRNTETVEDGTYYFTLLEQDYYANRTFYNIFYVKPNNTDPYGQDKFGPGQTKTTIDRFEDGNGYVLTRGAFLEDMYRRDPNTNARVIDAWTRTVLYLRPKLFVVYDRTTVASAKANQFMAFHLPKTPTANGVTAGVHRFDVANGSTFAGSISTVLPRNNQTTLVDIQSTPDDQNKIHKDKVYRLEVRPGSTGTEQRWLTVFDASASAKDVAVSTSLSAQDGNVLSGNVLGTRMRSAAGAYVVLYGAGAYNQTIAGTIRYSVPAETTVHVIADLPSSTGYAVSVQVAGGKHTIQIQPGTGFTTSKMGVLYIQISADGKVTPGS